MDNRIGFWFESKHGLSCIAENPLEKVEYRKRKFKMDYRKNEDGSYTSIGNDRWDSPTYYPTSYSEPLNFTFRNVNPHTERCLVSSGCERARNFFSDPEAMGIDFNDDVYWVHVLLQSDYGEDFGIYDEHFISSGDIDEYFGINTSSLTEWCEIKEYDGWYTLKKELSNKIALDVAGKLACLGYAPKVKLAE